MSSAEAAVGRNKLREAALVLSPNSLIHWQRRQHPNNIVVDGVAISIPIFLDHMGVPAAIMAAEQSSFTQVSQKFVAMLNLDGRRRQSSRSQHSTKRRSAKRKAVSLACLAALVVGALQTPLTGPPIYNNAVLKSHHDSSQVSPHAAFQVLLIEAAIYALLVTVFAGIAMRWWAANQFFCCYCSCNHISLNYGRQENNNNDFNLTYISTI